ncbi:MAG: tetratricopeptide repeat protein [Acidobacteriia bacterium]|nr:tetratricopeptide repeat protein [Terriglobia bacterium]
MSVRRPNSVRTVLAALVAFLFLSAVYLYTFPSPTLVYPAVVLLHVLAGVIAMVLLAWYAARHLRDWSALSWTGWALLGAGGILGIVLIFTGTPHSAWNSMYLHILLSLAAVVALAARGWERRRWLGGAGGTIARVAICSVAVVAISAFGYSWRNGAWLRSHVIKNRPAPATMDGEGDGPKGAFFPSSAQTADGKLIPGKFFLESQACERCHQTIYKQWYGSAHHFSSFNNQWYRKSIEYMQEVVGTRPSKWCGGCHDPAVLFSGMMDTPIKRNIHRPEAQAGLGCVMCHSIAKVKSTMGQGDFLLEYPRLHDLAASENPVVRALHDFMVKLNPEPHRRVFLKPFMRTQTAEFCSTCHKVHLDVPVNHYRWIRGFNEYDNWQASGVSGQGARSFYYPPKPAQCADCHMPPVKSDEAGNVNGILRSHAFAAANTALPTANQDPAQLAAVENFLEKSVSVDIFALSPALTPALAAGGARSEIATTFGVGEETETSVAPAGIEAAPVTAPLNRAQGVVRRGDTVRVDVVVRTRTVGHFFPGGTVDAYDTWLELKAIDGKSQVLFWSGMVEDNGRGPVEKGAHFYRALMIDGDGNPIDKRNAWSTRALVYVHLIPPGAADTVHFRLHVPENAGGEIKLHARLCYRKFSWWNTQFSFAGIPDPRQQGAEFTPNYDERRMVFTGSTADVSGKIKAIPNLPIVALAEDEVALRVARRGAPQPSPRTELRADDWTRWNDYGIGLFLQGDLKGASAAFQKIAEIDPSKADAWVNLGRVAVQEGDMGRARQVLERALALKPQLAAAHYFYARVLRNVGEYDEAEKHLRQVLAQYPRDRVARNDLGRVQFLQRKYGEAVGQFQAVLAIDPEDLQAHYNLMLCYQGLGNEAEARREQQLYLRFKADESSQAITGAYRQSHPEDNNERQPIHDHVSVPLSVLSAYNAERARVARNAAHGGGGK